MYTVHARNQIFELLKRMVINLRNTVRKNTQSVGLDERLLRELAWCGILCPGFNPRQKYSIAWKSGLDEFLNLLDHDWCLYFPFDTLSFADDRQLHELQVRNMATNLTSEHSNFL
jgi:hypothetical protein